MLSDGEKENTPADPKIHHYSHSHKGHGEQDPVHV